MIKVLYIVSSLQRSGPINIIYNIIKYLDRAKYTPIVLTLSSEKENSRKENFVESGIEIYSIHIRIATILSAIKKFKQTILIINPQIIHTTGIKADLLAAYFSNKVTTLKITSQLNFPYEDYVMSYGKIIGLMMAVSTKYAIKKFHYPLACSKDVAEKFHQKGIKLDFIYNGIDLASFPMATDNEIRETREALHFKGYKTIFIFVGVLTDRKMPEIAIRAFIKFQELNPNSCIIIVGDGKLKELCQEIAKGYNVYFQGTVTNTRQYLICSDFYIATSKAEGLPASVLEALALKIPVVLSDIKPHKEILQLNHEAGELCTTNDVDDTLNAMQKVVNEQSEKQKEGAYSIINKHLNAQIMSKKYQEYYEKRRLNTPLIL